MIVFRRIVIEQEEDKFQILCAKWTDLEFDFKAEKDPDEHHFNTLEQTMEFAHKFMEETDAN